MTKAKLKAMQSAYEDEERRGLTKIAVINVCKEVEHAAKFGLTTIEYKNIRESLLDDVIALTKERFPDSKVIGQVKMNEFNRKTGHVIVDWS